MDPFSPLDKCIRIPSLPLFHEFRFSPLFHEFSLTFSLRVPFIQRRRTRRILPLFDLAENGSERNVLRRKSGVRRLRRRILCQTRRFSFTGLTPDKETQRSMTQTMQTSKLCSNNFMNKL